MLSFQYYGASIDPNILFKVTINGRTLTSNGVRFGVAQYQTLAYTYLWASTQTITVNGQLETYSYFTVNPIYQNVYGLHNGDVEAVFFLRKQGNITGQSLFDEFTPSQITDKTSGNIIYRVDHNSSTCTSTSAQDRIIKGTFSCNLIYGESTIPASELFSLWYP